MTLQNLNQNEIDALVAAMEAADFGPEIVIETDDEYDDYEADGPPSEYDEWQDYMGGDDWDHGQYDHDYYDGGVDF